MDRSEVAHNAAIEGLLALGLTQSTAIEMMRRVEHAQPEEWVRTVERFSRGEAIHAFIFVTKYSRLDANNYTPFLYAGDKVETIAYLLRDSGKSEAGEVTGQPRLPAKRYLSSCFDIGESLLAALKEQ